MSCLPSVRETLRKLLAAFARRHSRQRSRPEWAETRGLRVARSSLFMWCCGLGKVGMVECVDRALDTPPRHQRMLYRAAGLAARPTPGRAPAAAIAPRTGRDAQAARLRGHLCCAGERGPTRMGREPPKPRILTLSRRHRVGHSVLLRGQPSRLRMGFVEWMPHLSPARCV
jgi:hypothetical protein